MRTVVPRERAPLNTIFKKRSILIVSPRGQDVKQGRFYVGYRRTYTRARAPNWPDPATVGCADINILLPILLFSAMSQYCRGQLVPLTRDRFIFFSRCTVSADRESTEFRSAREMLTKRPIEVVTIVATLRSKLICNVYSLVYAN